MSNSKQSKRDFLKLTLMSDLNDMIVFHETHFGKFTGEYWALGCH